MLNDVAVGTRGQVIALGDDDGGRIGWSKVVELKSGVTLELDPIVLLPPASKRAAGTQGVEVTIALPEGAAEADFTVSASYTEGNNHQMMKVERRSPTEFFIPCNARQEFSVSVHADGGGYLPMRRQGVSLKSGPVVLEIAAVATTEVEVLDEHGQPLESFELQIFKHRYHRTPGVEPESSVTGSAGVASFTPPSFPWRLRIVAGDGLADLSPFDEGTYSGPRTIQLEASTTYRGRAERSGRPWANATISLRERSPAGLHFQQGEILSRAKPGGALARVKAGADGTFSLPAVKAGDYVVAAQSPDTPAAILEVGHEPELLLTAPSTGTISGSVQAKFGELSPGIVTVSQEFGLQRSVRFESDGAFRFEDLPEGRWRLGQTYWSYGDAWLAEPDESARMSGSPGPFAGTVAEPRSSAQRAGVDVHVVAGETTDVQLLVQTEPPITLEGTVLMDGRRPRERRLHFQREPFGLGQSVIDQRWERASRKGQFKVELPGAGRWRLSSQADFFELALFADFDVAGGAHPAPIEVNFETGTLILRGVSEARASSVVVKGPKTGEFQFGANQYLMNDGAERLTLRGMLAGEVQIMAFSEGPNKHAIVLKTGILEPGATLEIDLAH